MTAISHHVHRRRPLNCQDVGVRLQQRFFSGKQLLFAHHLRILEQFHVLGISTLVNGLSVELSVLETPLRRFDLVLL